MTKYEPKSCPISDSTNAFIASLFEKAYTPVGELECTAYVTSEPVSFDERTSGKKMKLAVGDKWAKEVFDCAWFHITGEISGDITDNTVFLINCGGEGLICDKDGIEKQAITCYASEFDYSLGKPVKRVVFNDNLTDGNKVDFWIDCAANDLFGKIQNDAALQELCVAVRNPEIRSLAYDMQTLLSVCENAPESDFAAQVTTALVETAKSYNAQAIDESTAAAVRSELKPLLETKNNGDNIFEYTSVGHAHLDLAWLWPIRETKRKGARTFSNQITNIAKYPGYIFGASQAQLYRWVKDGYPRIYDKVKQLAKDGSWDVQGATWVEPDSNLISGESLIRQFYYGKRFFKEEFGQDMKIFWVPDSFGYSACIPQVMKLAGVDYFLTQKMSRNTVTDFPYHTFNWKGLDGSEVFAHLLPEDTYNSPCNAARACFGERNYTQRSISDKSLMLFGIGDGGGGPGFEHIERLRRLSDLKQVPKVNPGKALDFFKRLDDKAIAYPTHSGELYLEKHQGTYTTQSKNKRYNRKCEFALRNYELLMSAALNCGGIDVPITVSELDEMWQEILLYQFHDILPGSSINRVYEESTARYRLILDRLETAINYVLSELVSDECFFNFTSYSCEHTYKLGDKWYRINVPAINKAYLSQAKELEHFSAAADGNSIENDKVKITFKDGVIVSFFDKTLGREFADAAQPMGVFSQYSDNGDCWDIMPVNYHESKTDAACTVFETGTDGASAFAKCVFTVGDSTIKQTIKIIDGSPLAEIDIDIDCRQSSSMLRCAFPTNVVCDEAAFNIQFGHIKRKTTENTDAEKAQFEVSAHKFVDLSDGKQGLALLNDCKYGYRCKGSVIDVDLIRSPEKGPGTDVDQGKNVIKLALYPHEGAAGKDVYKQAYLLNNPVISVSGISELPLIPTYKTNNENIVLETVKHPIDENGFILRFYNASETQQTADVSLSGYKASETVNILENTICPLESGKLTLKPFELINVRFVNNRTE